jgi:hypothetical protein
MDGYELYCMDSENLKTIMKVKDFIAENKLSPKCCEIEMKFTKIFGDQSGYARPQFRLQFKCVVCCKVNLYDVVIP